MNWYYKNTNPVYLIGIGLYPWNHDPFFEDKLVTGGSNSYEQYYGGFPVMIPWADPYYPAKN
jgi:hypothetical protein